MFAAVTVMGDALDDDEDDQEAEREGDAPNGCRFFL